MWVKGRHWRASFAVYDNLEQTHNMTVKTPVADDFLQKSLTDVLADACAPVWNFSCSDRLEVADHARLTLFKDSLRENLHGSHKTPPNWLWPWLWRKRLVSSAFRQRIPIGFLPQEHWSELPTANRSDLVNDLSDWVAEDVSYNQMMIYGSSGTTGHPLLIPKTPYAAALYQVALQFCFEQHGVKPDFKAGEVGNMLICAQHHTVIYGALLSTWGNSIHLKVNLHKNAWRNESDRDLFLTKYNPPVLTGDPISFAELLRLDLPLTPVALASTALKLPESLKEALETRFLCPVVDFYAMNETGPIAFACPKGAGFHVFMPDLYVEVLDENGFHVADGAWGEVTVTGGGNDFLPLLRYRTGDHVQFFHGVCSCGVHLPRLVGLSGRKPVPLFHKNGARVNEADVAKVLRYWPIVAFSLYQQLDKSIELTVRWRGDKSVVTADLVVNLKKIFGDLPITLIADRQLGQEQKPLPFISAFTTLAS